MIYPAAIEAALDSGGLSLALFFHFDFKTEPFSAWTGHGPIEIAGRTWRGAGELTRLPDMEQLINGQAERLTIEVSGATAALQALALGEIDEIEGREVEIGFVLFDTARRPIGGLQALDTGIMGPLGVQRSAAGDGLPVRGISFDIASPMATRSTRALAYYTDVDQRLRHPGDKGCERVTTKVVLTWPDF